MRRLLLPFFFALAAMTMSSCLERTENKSVVHPDGSITRTILFDGDSSTIARRSFKLRLDSSWTLSAGGSGPRSWSLKAEQTFHDTRAMNNALRGEPGKTLTATVLLEKGFQWFYTSFRYKETWKCFRVIDAEPLSKYLSNAEMDLFLRLDAQKEELTPGDSVALADVKSRFTTWNRRNLFESYYREFLKGLEMVNSSRLTSADVERHKDELFQASGEKLEKGQHEAGVRDIFAAVLKSPVVAEAFRANALGFKSVDNARQFEVDVWASGSFKASVTMPGVITATNATKLEGNTAHWDDFLFLAGLRDTDLIVESRMVNWWAVAVTGVVVISILVYLAAALLRRRAISSGI